MTRVIWHYWHEPIISVGECTLKRRRDVIVKDKPTKERRLRLARMHTVKDRRVREIIRKISGFRVMANHYLETISSKDRIYILKIHKKECPKCPWKSARRGSLVGNLLTRFDRKKDEYY